MRFMTHHAEPEELLDAVLAPVHDEWLEEVRRVLVPATTPNAPFWDRWSAVRYLNDLFLARLRLERGLVADLRPFVPAARMAALEEAGDRLTRLYLALDQLGRRRGTAAAFAGVTDRFLEALGRWCAEIEIAASWVSAGELGNEARRIVARLEPVVLQRAV